MTDKPKTIKEYIDKLPEERKGPIKKLRAIIRKHIPNGFKEEINYGMIGYVVPHSKYPAGYHCDTKQPLPFLNLASQKSHIGLYHMGVYADPKLYKWFTTEYPKHATRKLDMGKSCVRFKKLDDIPYELVGELVSKMTVDDWIKLYEKAIKN